MGRTSAEDQLGWAGHRAGLLLHRAMVWSVRSKGLASQGSRHQPLLSVGPGWSQALQNPGSWLSQWVPDQLIAWKLLKMQSPGLCPSHLASISGGEAQGLPAQGPSRHLALASLLHGWPAAGSHSNLREGQWRADSESVGLGRTWASACLTGSWDAVLCPSSPWGLNI